MTKPKVTEKILHIPVSESIGAVSAVILEPSSCTAMMTLAHGAGAGMNHTFMVRLAQTLAELSIGTIRFNFPYMEHGKKRPDMPATAHKTIEQIIEFTEQHYPALPLYVSGKSFGGRMTSQLLAKKTFSQVKGIIFYGFPLHPAGAPAVDRSEHLHEVAIPMLFLQGTKDTLAQWDLITKVTSSLSAAKLISFEGADHSFKVKKNELIPELAEATRSFIQSL
jgi:predicted alpha/beta-hydrolase family hydrolase